MDFLGHLEREAAALLAAVSDLDADVPGCPGWQVRDLVVHIGRVHHFWCEVVERGTVDARPDVPRPEVDVTDRDRLVGWARQQADRLLAVLGELDPNRPLWNWTRGPQVAAFVPRRMAHETAVHRVDAEAATGTPGPIDPELARDGIDELLTLILPVSGGYDGPEATLWLAAPDVDGAWTVRLTAPEPVVLLGHRGAADATVTADASELLLGLWGRSPATVDGDQQIWEAFRAHLATD